MFTPSQRTMHGRRVFIYFQQIFPSELV